MLSANMHARHPLVSRGARVRGEWRKEGGRFVETASIFKFVRSRVGRGKIDLSFRICPIENLSDARGVPSRPCSLVPTLPSFCHPPVAPATSCFIHLFTSSFLFLLFPRRSYISLFNLAAFDSSIISRSREATAMEIVYSPVLL